MRPPRMIHAVEHDERISVVDHLDELRSRIIIALVAITVAFAGCFWQNHRLLHLLGAPLSHQTQEQVRNSSSALGASYWLQQSTRDVASQTRTLAAVLDRRPETSWDRSVLRRVRTNLAADLYRLAVPLHGERPVTLGIGEPFSTTVTVALVFALVLSLPIVLVQAYAYFLPAVAPQQRRQMRSLTAAVPLLFIAGVGFGYFVVLPAAVRFFVNFNGGEFNVLVQASSYYKFAATTLLGMGLLFQVPIAIVSVVRAGVVTPRQLRANRRYAIGLCALVAAVLPGDAITMLLETAPLYLLFEVGIVVAAFCDRRMRTRSAVGPAASLRAADEQLGL